MIVWLWVGFIAFVLLMLLLDLLVVNRKAHVFGTGESLAWTGFCILLAVAFGFAVFAIYERDLWGIATQAGAEAMTGKRAMMLYFTAWLVEYALSLDNIMVFALVFGYFQVPAQFQHRVLFWGVLGALIMRGVMIFAGTALLERFHWLIYVFWALLLLTAVKLLVSKDEAHDVSETKLVKAIHRVLPVAEHYDGQRFFTRQNGALMATPLFVVLLVVEFTDLIFAVDSIPAVIGITTDPFLVFTSNVFAILGLRSLYFALAAIIHRFRYVKTSLVFVLTFIGVKMMIGAWYEIPVGVSLSVVGGLLAVGLLASLLSPRTKQEVSETTPIDELADLAEYTWRRARKIAIAIIGITVLLIAIPVGILPGPGGIFVGIGGLMILATEFIWARVLLKRLRKKADDLRRRAERMLGLAERPISAEAGEGAVAGSMPAEPTLAREDLPR